MRSSQRNWYSRVAKHLRAGSLAERSRKQEAISEAREALRSLAELGNPQESGTLEDQDQQISLSWRGPFQNEGLLDAEREAKAALERLTTLELERVSRRRPKALPADRTLLRRRLHPDGRRGGQPRQIAVETLTRYATHLVLLLIAAAVVAGGGFKALSVHASPGDGGTQIIDERYIGSDMGLDYVEMDPVPNTETLYLADADTHDRPALAQVETTTRKAITTYKVEQGDTISSLSQKFGISTDTILQANAINDPEAELSPGQDLTILPITGVLHKVKEGDTVESIAREYLADPRVIVAYEPNGLQESQELKPDQAIVVPDGKRPPRDKSITYKVKPGETLSSIALRFDLTVETITLANSIDDPDSVREGTELVLLPISGMKHEVKQGDSINSIAQLYRVDPKAIVDYKPNHLSPDSQLEVGQVVIVPGGKKPEPPRTVTARSDARPGEDQGSVQAAAEPLGENKPTQATGQFVWPAKGRLTQYFSSRHNGLDIAAPLGTPVYAADAGIVTAAGWDPYGLGNHVRIDHGNGYRTIYGHFSKILVRAGQYVERGQQIALMGSTGRSTGPHVHFVIVRGTRGYVNPLDYLP